MSGILGSVSSNRLQLEIDRLRDALRLLKHRGPDAEEILLFDSFGRTLSLPRLPSSSDAPLSSSGSPIALLACCCSNTENASSITSQCIGSMDRRAFLACDGVVDNGLELSRELRKAGHNVQPSSAREVLLGVLAHWGPDGLSRITGSFAIAALDFQRRCLVLARDAFGTRPLYRSGTDGCSFFFASQIGALLEVTRSDRKVNRTSLFRYLVHNSMDHGKETFFAGVEQIPAGHYVEVPLDSPRQVSLVRYRRLVPVKTELSFELAAERLRELVVRSVASQAVGHRDMGAALSGGFDSSFVVASSERIKPLKLYTCVPVANAGTFSQTEERWADLVAANLGFPLKQVRVTAPELPENFATLLRLQEEPFSSPVVFAQLQVFRAAKDDGIKVMLSGQGGDTLFAVSADQLLKAIVAHARRLHLVQAVALYRATRRFPEGSIRRLARAAARTLGPELLQIQLRQLRRQIRVDWLNQRWFGSDRPDPPESFCPPMLRFEDRNAAACSIMNRMPLLTTEIQDFVSSLPAEHLVVANNPLKSIEGAAMRGIVPEAILARKERLGFPVPIREWLCELSPWAETQLAEVESFPFLDAIRVRQTWERFRAKNDSVSAAGLIWRWIFLAGWTRHLSVNLN